MCINFPYGGVAMKWRELPEEAADRFDLPADAVAGMPRITITGRSRVLIENHKGLLEYGEETIEVAGGRLRIRIRGTDLQLRAMDREDLIITGRILTVELI